MQLSCSFFRDSHDAYGRLVNTTWQKLCNRLADHQVGEKDGPALTCGTFLPGQRRGNASLTQRTMVALDVESSRDGRHVPPAFDATVRHITALRVKAFCWTTHSHSPAAPRYRVLMPLGRALPYDAEIDVAMSAVVSAELRLYEVCDQSKFGAASLFYLPRHREGSEFMAVAIEGNPIEVGQLQTSALTRAQQVEASAAEAAARRAANALDPELQARIEQYNQSHPLIDRLRTYGYQRDGNRWRSRYQHGQGATTVLPDGMTWVSFSESDAAEGVGRRPLRPSSQCSCFGDAFSLYVHYERGGSFRSALESLRCP